MLHMCVCMYSRFIKNHPIRILEDGPLISEVVLSHDRTSINNPPVPILPRPGRDLGIQPSHSGASIFLGDHGQHCGLVDISYAAPQAHRIVNVALH
jgi:hypothetical protein